MHSRVCPGLSRSVLALPARLMQAVASQGALAAACSIDAVLAGCGSRLERAASCFAVFERFTMRLILPFVSPLFFFPCHAQLTLALVSKQFPACLAVRSTCMDKTDTPPSLCLAIVLPQDPQGFSTTFVHWLERALCAWKPGLQTGERSLPQRLIAAGSPRRPASLPASPPAQHSNDLPPPLLQALRAQHGCRPTLQPSSRAC